MAYIGARLRQARESRKLTQEELAKLVPGMTRTDISTAENDRVSIGPARLARLAAALDVSVLELQPEADPDQRALDLLGRLEALEAAFAAERRSRERATQGAVARLAALEAALGLQERRPTRRGRGR